VYDIECITEGEEEGRGEMNGGVGIEYSWLNSLYLSEIIVKRYL
jgi:hypothetical protein